MSDTTGEQVAEQPDVQALRLNVFEAMGELLEAVRLVATAEGWATRSPHGGWQRQDGVSITYEQEDLGNATIRLQVPADEILHYNALRQRGEL